MSPERLMLLADPKPDPGLFNRGAQPSRGAIKSRCKTARSADCIARAPCDYGG
jgi:hypothetical protein